MNLASRLPISNQVANTDVPTCQGAAPCEAAAGDAFAI
jgi:hypothetical protein